MGKDEAVSMLLDLASIDEASYLTEHPKTTWPPQAAYTIVSECGLLPITLTIAAQAVRAWGKGYVGRSIILITIVDSFLFRLCHPT